jgi:gliding motility-associated-like protein
MKIVGLSILFSLMFQFSSAQIICIKCFDQNNTITNPSVNWITNGSFENISGVANGYICPSFAEYNCDINNWTCIGGGNSTYAQLENSIVSVVPDGNNAVYMGNYFCNACSALSNDTDCLSSVDCELVGLPAGYPQNTPGFGGANGVSLVQTVSGLTVGNGYVLEFWAGGEEVSAFPNDGLFGVDIGFGYNIFSCKGTSVFPPNNIGTRYIIEFLATSGTHTVKFTNWGHICFSCTEIILDDVKLYNLAELPDSIPSCTTLVSADTLHIPNVFTPNADGLNDAFEIYYSGSKTYQLYIYNRWGEEVFESKDKTKHWNGKINASNASEGTYFYLLYIGGEPNKGFLTLFR